MSFRRRQKSRLVEAALDMTPLIDVVFLLVIFLLISTTFKKKQLAIQLDLPRVSKEQFVSTVREHQIRIEDDGGLFLCPNEEALEGDAVKCSEPTDRARLVREFKRLSKQYPGTRLGVYAGAEVEYEHVMKVIAAAIEAGIDLNLPYQQEDDSEGPSP